MAKYVAALEEHGLIRTERTEIITKGGLKRNGCLRYTILPIKNALALCYERQLEKAGQAMERQRESRARKTAKYALLTRGRAGVWERAAHAEGSDTTPVSQKPNLLLFDTGAKGEQSAWVHRFSPGYGEFR